MDRREVLQLAAMGLVAAFSGCGTASKSGSIAPTTTVASTTIPPASTSTTTTTTTSTTATSTTSSSTTSTTVPPPLGPQLTKVPIPDGPLSRLPDGGSVLAWTLDDGTNADVIRSYIELVATTDVRLTMFVAGMCFAWRDVADELRPFVDSGQIQLANHSYHHPNLTDLTYNARVHEIQRDHDFLLDTFGVDARPFWRPPYGIHGPQTDLAAASIGYTTPVMWSGTLAEAGATDSSAIVRFASKYFQPGIIVLGHLNHPTATKVFPDLLAILDERGLKTATLNDVYLWPKAAAIR